MTSAPSDFVFRYSEEDEDFHFHVELTERALATLAESVLLTLPRDQGCDIGTVASTVSEIMRVPYDLAIRQVITNMAIQGRLLLYVDGGISLRQAASVERSPEAEGAADDLIIEVEIPEPTKAQAPCEDDGADITKQFENAQSAARNLWEAGEATIKDIAGSVGVSTATIKRWATRGHWNRRDGRVRASIPETMCPACGSATETNPCACGVTLAAEIIGRRAAGKRALEEE